MFGDVEDYCLKTGHDLRRPEFQDFAKPIGGQGLIAVEAPRCPACSRVSFPPQPSGTRECRAFALQGDKLGLRPTGRAVRVWSVEAPNPIFRPLSSNRQICICFIVFRLVRMLMRCDSFRNAGEVRGWGGREGRKPRRSCEREGSDGGARPSYCA